MMQNMSAKLEVIIVFTESYLSTSMHDRYALVWALPCPKMPGERGVNILGVMAMLCFV